MLRILPKWMLRKMKSRFMNDGLSEMEAESRVATELEIIDGNRKDKKKLGRPKKEKESDNKITNTKFKKAFWKLKE